MCLAQGPQRSDAGEARTRAPRSRVKHSTTEPLRSLIHKQVAIHLYTCSHRIKRCKAMIISVLVRYKQKQKRINVISI